MRLTLGLSMLTTALLCAQSWEQFSIGMPVKGGNRFGPFSIEAQHVTLRQVAARAYGIAENRIAGPDWIGKDQFALTAVAKNQADFRTLLRRELAHRFGFSAHRETRDADVYWLQKIPGVQPKLNPPVQQQTQSSSDSVGRSSISIPNATMGTFADMLSRMAGRPVTDQTGIKDRFAVEISSEKEGELSGAIRRQLGLQLVPGREMIDFLVVDHATMPDLH